MMRVTIATLLFLGFLTVASAQGQGAAFRTQAGRPATTGNADGVGSAARFNNPTGMAMDGSGNLYMADTLNNSIRKIAPDGTTTTFAGGQAGSADGNGTNASFRSPVGVVVDANGNIYVADQSNNTIRKITPDGTVSTLAGFPGSKGGVDDSGTNARFTHPAGLAVDGAGNLYVADAGNNRIRTVTRDGVVGTLAGPLTNSAGGSMDGASTNASFYFPMALAVDGSTNIYVTDTGNDTIRKITPDGTVSTLAGTPRSRGSSDGAATNARFAFPQGIAVDGSGNLYVADTGNNTLRRINPDGTVVTLAGQAGLAGATDGAGTNALFNQPMGLVLDGSGNLFVVDSANNSIREIATNRISTTFAGPGGSAGSDNGIESSARFYYPNSVAVDTSSNIYVADVLNFVVRKITADGVVSVLAGQIGQSGDIDGPATNALFASPNSVAVDGLGNVYVADSDNQTIRLIGNGMVSTVAGHSGKSGSADGTGTNAFFNFPLGIALDVPGNIYVADGSNQTVRVISTNGVVSTLAGKLSKTGSANGIGTNAMFSSPTALAVDGSGNVYVADSANEIIRKIAPDATVTTVAGLAGHAGSADGGPTNATFSSMSGLAVDATGNIYVADTFNNTIRMITSAGVVTTLGGVAGTRGNVDGAGTNSAFNNPSAIAVDAAGNLYVADTFNNTIRVGTRMLVALPALQITGLPSQVIISWSGSATGFVLQSSPALSPPVVWLTLNNIPTMVGGQFVVTNQAGDPAGFFRLRTP